MRELPSTWRAWDSKGALLIVPLYVDDLLVTGSNGNLLTKFKKQMQAKFEMSDLGDMTYFLGLEVFQSNEGIFINQKSFALKILNRFCMKNYKPTKTPIGQGEKLLSHGEYERVYESNYRSLVGYLLYLTTSRLDIIFFVSLLSRFMYCCNVIHFKAAKRVLKALKGTSSLRDQVYLVGAQGSKKLLHNQQLNLICIAIAKNLVLHGKTKHFKIKYHFIRKVKQSNEVKLVHCSSDVQLVDILTKPLGRLRFKRLRHDTGVHSIMAKEECKVSIHAVASSTCKATSSLEVTSSNKPTSSTLASSPKDMSSSKL
ncbi:cysteine-rich receptor-like protein kinase 5 [Gossypium australe]|uniref:Cysteine-rich receptor-like protein kinase 5 n=1 Tax=Gossypium australe TaxID=47621 RepID=A0A5B6X2R4_9ROSI|nr:cysteine-rich receptor-like protein kinase 5 [Gossypium australe]